VAFLGAYDYRLTRDNVTSAKYRLSLVLGPRVLKVSKVSNVADSLVPPSGSISAFSGPD
jgi:hypothetical protein